MSERAPEKSAPTKIPNTKIVEESETKYASSHTRLNWKKKDDTCTGRWSNILGNMYLYNGVIDELGLVVNPTGTLVRLARRVLERPDVAQFLRRVVAVVSRVRLALTVLFLLRIVRSD